MWRANENITKMLPIMQLILENIRINQLKMADVPEHYQQVQI